MELLTLAQMEIGETGEIIEVRGGLGLTRRLNALGVRPGKKVTKISSTYFRGPVTFKIDNTQVAIGFGMARKIVIQMVKYLPDNR